VDGKLTFWKRWPGPGIRGVMDTVSGRNKLNVVHTESIKFYTCSPVGIKSKYSRNQDYYGQMKYKKFSQWVTYQDIPNLPPNSMAMHLITTWCSPGKYANKEDMVN
jgi:hypothetical protein